jgi:hypothetical protein
MFLSKHAACSRRSLTCSIQFGIDRHCDEFVQKFYQRKIDLYGTSALNKEQFRSALEELGTFLSEDDFQNLFLSMDINDDGVIDLDEFKRALRIPTQIEQLFSTLPFHRLFANAVPKTSGKDPLRSFAQLKVAQVKELVHAVMPYLEKAIFDEVTKLRECFDAMDKSEANLKASKFEVPIEMSTGRIEDFHCGLSKRIGLMTVAHFFVLQKGIFSLAL